MPITLQTFAVMLAGCVLGPVRGFAAVAVYLALGAVGLPVFAEHSSGIDVFTGPTAATSSPSRSPQHWEASSSPHFARERRTRALVVFACSIPASILVIHPLGVLGMSLHFDVTLGRPPRGTCRSGSATS